MGMDDSSICGHAVKSFKTWPDGRWPQVAGELAMAVPCWEHRKSINIVLIITIDDSARMLRNRICPPLYFYSKQLRTNFDDFWMGPKKKVIRFGGDPDVVVDAGSLSRILYDRRTETPLCSPGGSTMLGVGLRVLLTSGYYYLANFGFTQRRQGGLLTC